MERGTPGSARWGPARSTTSPRAACGSCGIPRPAPWASLRTGRWSPSGVACRIPPGAGLVDAGWAVPTMGGPLRPYLKGISELDWSPDGRRIVYHPPAPGDPLFVTEPDEKVGRQIYAARPGVHNHFPVWSPDGAFIYFVQGLPLDESDVWRIRPTGGEPERLTFHDSRVTFPTLAGRAGRCSTWPPTTMDPGPGSTRWTSNAGCPTASAPASRSTRRWRRARMAGALVATVSRSTAGLWRVPIADHVIDESGATPICAPDRARPVAAGGAGFIVYRAPKAGTDGLWKLADGASTELWSGVEGRVLGGPAIAPDGQRLAFLVQTTGTDATVRDERRRNRRAPGRRGARRARSARLVAGWAVAGGRGQSGWRAAAVQDPGRRRDAGPARERVLDRSGLVSERTVPRLFGRGRGHDVSGEGGDRGRRAHASAEAGPHAAAPGVWPFSAGTTRWSS